MVYTTSVSTLKQSGKI